MKHGTLVAALIVVSTPVSRASSGEPVRLVPDASSKNGAMAAQANKFSFNALLYKSGFINMKFAMPVRFGRCFRHA